MMKWYLYGCWVKEDGERLWISVDKPRSFDSQQSAKEYVIRNKTTAMRWQPLPESDSRVAMLLLASVA